MEPDLAILRPENIRFMTLEDCTLKILLAGDAEIVFQFRNREQIDKMLPTWAKRSGVIEKLPRQETVELHPDSRTSQIYSLRLGERRELPIAAGLTHMPSVAALCRHHDDFTEGLKVRERTRELIKQSQQVLWRSKQAIAALLEVRRTNDLAQSNPGAPTSSFTPFTTPTQLQTKRGLQCPP